MKKLLIPVFIFFVLLFLFPSLSVEGAKSGLLLWFNTIIPTLFPFILITNIIRELDGIRYFEKFLGFMIQKVFGTSPGGSYPIITGFLSGYPVGAKTVADTYVSGYITVDEANYLLSFCNNPSPMYIINFAVLANLGDARLILPVFVIIYTSTLTCSLINRYLMSRKQRHNLPSFRYMDIIHAQDIIEAKPSFFDSCIINSFELICKVGGYLILFSIVNQYIKAIPLNNPLIQYTAMGLIEQTTGIALLTASSLSESIKIVLVIVFTCFGGLSIIAQTYSVIRVRGLSIKKYVFNKILTASLAALLSLGYVFFFYYS